MKKELLVVISDRLAPHPCIYTRRELDAACRDMGWTWDESDVISLHDYGTPAEREKLIAERKGR